MIEILIDIMFIKRNQISLNCHSDQTSLLTAIWTNTMGISLNCSSVSIGCALAFTLILSTVQAASLPKDIEVDITMKKITSLIEAENYIEALPYFEQLEAMNISLPEGFYYFQIKSLDKTTDTKKTLTQAESYFTDRTMVRMESTTTQSWRFIVGYLCVKLRKKQLPVRYA